jgi:hypothetical protein
MPVTFTTIGKVPVCVGVPERTPLLESVRPAGSGLVVVKTGVPMAPDWVKVWLKALAAVPLLTAGLVTVIGGQGAMWTVTVAMFDKR